MYKNKATALLSTPVATPTFLIDAHETGPASVKPKTLTKKQLLLREEAWALASSPFLVPSSEVDVNALFCNLVPDALASEWPHDEKTAKIVNELLFEAPWKRGQINLRQPDHYWIFSSRTGTVNEGIWRRFIGDTLVDEVTVSTSRDGEVEFYEYDPESAPYTCKIQTLEAISFWGGGASIFLRLPEVCRPARHPEPEIPENALHYFGYNFRTLFRLHILGSKGPRDTSRPCPTCCHKSCELKGISCTCGCTCRFWDFTLEEAAHHTGIPHLPKEGKCRANLSTKRTTLITGHGSSDGVAIAFNYEDGIGASRYESDPSIRAHELIMLKWATLEVQPLFKRSFVIRTPETTPLLERKNPFERKLTPKKL
ncbi:hypothetical protein NMY22_g4941 [Coprinellus aureogranulatus]|nr:hypothetical protein NMY22_g4941 [Coprinellus aureogranulatus]